jgi:hypothetical protein
MSNLSNFTDPYDRKARLYPALICLFPIMISIAISFPKTFSTFSGFVALAAGTGLLQFLTHLARDRGKALEEELYYKWGGMPSVTLFRHRDDRISKPAKIKYHNFMSRASNINAPTKEEESSQPTIADEIYLSWSDFLRGKTRDKKKFELIFKENINYGFRRNLLGIKWYCVLSSLTALTILFSPIINSGKITELIISTALLCTLYIFIFIIVVTDSWVKVVADSYGKQLIEAINA